jgi:protein Tex
VVERILARVGKAIGDVMGRAAILKELKPEQFTDDKFGVPTVKDILAELEKPGRDPRPQFKTATFQEGVETIADLQPGMILEGVVTNVAAFGAFVDIGVHQDGLVHVSALADKFVKDPHEIVKPGQIVKVRVMDVDVKRQRIALSMRLTDASGNTQVSNQGRPEANPNAARSQRDKQPTPANRQANRPAQPTGLFAIALEKAKQKK